MATKRKPKRAADTHKHADLKRTRKPLKDLDMRTAAKVTGGRKKVPCL